MRWIPCQRPINSQTLVFVHCGSHSVGLSQARGKGLFHDDVGTERCDLFDRLGVPPRCRTQQHNIGFGGFNAGSKIREHSLRRDAKILNALCHFFRRLVTYPHNFNVGMLERHAQIIPHVKVFKIDSGYAPCLIHFLTFGLWQSKKAEMVCTSALLERSE